MEPIPEAGVQENVTQLVTGKRQILPVVLIQVGEKVEETFTVELGEMHGELSQHRKRGLVPRAVIGLLVGSNNEPTARIVWPRYMMPPQAHAGGLHI